MLNNTSRRSLLSFFFSHLYSFLVVRTSSGSISLSPLCVLIEKPHAADIACGGAGPSQVDDATAGLSGLRISRTPDV